MWILFACSGAPATAEAPPPVTVATPTSPAPGATFHTLASTLNLRAEPRADAAKVGRLAINSPVRIVAVAGEWTQVRTANEKVGWVGTAFIADDPLPLQVAVERAAAATDPADGLSWAQRAAAIAPDDPVVLRALAARYRATGDLASATQVEARAAWPDIHPVLQPTTDGIRVELEIGGDTSVATTPIPDTAWAAHHLASSDSWWVLPDVGAAVPGRPTQLAWFSSNECGGSMSLRATLQADLPAGTVAIAAIRAAEPPPGWRTEAPVPDRSAMVAALTQAARDAGAGTGLVVAVAPTPTGFTGRAYWDDPHPSDEELFPEHPGLDVQFDAGGKRRSSRREEIDGLAPPLPLATRDLDGDGTPETVWDISCATLVTGADGGTRAQTDFRCCGC